MADLTAERLRGMIEALEDGLNRMDAFYAKHKGTNALYDDHVPMRDLPHVIDDYEHTIRWAKSLQSGRFPNGGE